MTWNLIKTRRNQKMSKFTGIQCDICKCNIVRESFNTTLSMDTCNNPEPDRDFGMTLISNKNYHQNPRLNLENLCAACSKTILYRMEETIIELQKMYGESTG